MEDIDVSLMVGIFPGLTEREVLGRETGYGGGKRKPVPGPVDLAHEEALRMLCDAS